MQVLKNCALLFVLLMLVPSRSSAQECAAGNNPSLLTGVYGFHFDAVIPFVVNRGVQTHHVSVIGAAVYDGKGTVTIFYNGYVTLQPGKVQLLFQPSAQKLTGTYCAYSHGWDSLSVSDGADFLWNWMFITANGELDTVAIDPRPYHGYSVTFSQTKR